MRQGRTLERSAALKHNRSSSYLTSAGWVLGLVVTSLILWWPYLGFAYRSPAVHLVLDTVDACVALLVAYLVYGRFVRGRRLQDLLLAQSLLLLSVAGFALTYLTASFLGDADPVAVWLPLSVRLVGALLVAAAALVGTRARVSTASRWGWLTVPGLVLVLAFLVLAAGQGLLPTVVVGADLLDPAEPPLLADHPLLIVSQALAAACFAVASVAFTMQAARRDDELLRWLGAACALGALARVNYAIFPSLYTDWLYTGDALRTGFYLLLLIGAARELSQYWRSQTRTAVLEDRRRLARELHDGLLQELAYIRAEGHRIPVESPARGHILAAADRAADEARAAVHALGAKTDEPLGFVLHRTARELAERHGVDLQVDLDDGVEANADQRHALTRITREAVANAIRHGQAQRVAIELSRCNGSRNLAIRDDGVGFDVQAAVQAGTGFGIPSMRDRARAIPGSLQIQSAEGRGSEVRVAW